MHQLLLTYYVRSVVNQSFSLKRKDILLFIPAVLYSLTLLPFYSKSADGKREVISQFIENNALIAKEPEGSLPQGWGVAARVILGITLIAVQFVLLYRTKKKITATGNTLKQNQAIIRWLYLFTTVLLLIYVVLFFVYFFLLQFSIDLNFMVSLSLTLTILFISLALLARPSILYGLKGWIHHEFLLAVDAGSSPGAFTSTEDDESSLTADQGRAFKEALENHFKLNFPFVKPGYKIADLAKELDIPAYLLSPFINQEYGKNFKELVNDYRIDYLSDLLRTSPDLSLYSLEGMASKAGFNSRSTFFNAVKRKTGMPPSEYFTARSSPQEN